jgi:hypothetical protein
MQYVERQIVAWLLIAMGAFFLARAVVSKRERGAMKELLGIRVDRVKLFRDFIIQRLDALAGFVFVLLGVGIHLYVLVREHQALSHQNNPREALGGILAWLAGGLLVALALATLIHWVTTTTSRRIFLENLAYLIVRYRFRIQDDPELLLQVGDMLGLVRAEDDTIESYARRVEAALDLDTARAQLIARGKLPAGRANGREGSGPYFGSTGDRA